MPAEWRYRGRVVTAEDVAFIRRFIAQNPGASRRRLSAKLCEAWQWKQANGALRDMVCRGLLLMLHRAGEIELPPVEARGAQSDRGAAKARARGSRQSSSRRATSQHHSAGVCASAAHAGRSFVQQFGRAV